MFKKNVCVIQLVSLGCCLGFMACAPSVVENPAPTPEPAAIPTAAPVAPVVPVARVTVVATALPQATPEVRQEEVVLPQFDPHNPDWKLRYQQLYGYYFRQFEAPKLGESVEVLLISGTRQQGVLESLSETEMVLNLGSGQVTLVPESLAESSRAEFFQAQYAHLNALARGRSEYAAWQARGETARRPTPVPAPPQIGGDNTTRPRIVGGIDGVNAAHRIDPNAAPPKNEGPKGRVWQVDQYIRKNAAIPHSLRFIEWGQVLKQGDGYTVRVKYTLESAEGLGTSTENMTFFMYVDGTVYRKAPNKN